MNDKDLARYNRRLGDARGRNPWGNPVYRWFHSSDPLLQYPVRYGIGHTEWIRQIDADRWLIGMWYASCPEGQWRAQFPDLAYPKQGMYYATDVMLCEGIEPNDTITDDVIGKLKAREGKTFRECLDEIESSRAARERSLASTRYAIIDNAATAFGNLPGARGGSVSFGGVDESQLVKKD